jgi:hypothetical protein
MPGVNEAEPDVEQAWADEAAGAALECGGLPPL